MVLSAIADCIYKFYCLLHYIVTFICYVGYLLYYIIYKVIVTLQNVTVFAQMVYEDNHHLIQDTKAIIVGTSDFFIANIEKVGNAVCLAGTAFLDGTVAIANFLKWTVWFAKRNVVLVGDAAWFLITAPYQLLLFFDGVLSNILEMMQRKVYIAYTKCGEALVDVMRYFTQEVRVQSVCGLVILLLIYQNPEPLKLMLNFMMEMVLTGGEYLATAFRAALLHIKLIGRSERGRRMEMIAGETTIGSCIICEEYERAVAFIPCGHLSVCKACARTIYDYNPKCPLCRSNITLCQDVYI